MAATPPLTPVAQPRAASSTIAAIGGVAAAWVGARFLRFVKVLVVARLLGPESFGAYALVAVLVNYGQFLDLGAATAAFRDLAAAVGRGDAREAARSAGRIGSLKLAAALLLGAGAMLATLVPGVPAAIRPVLLATPAIAVSSALLAQLLLQLQGEGRSREFGRVTAAAAAADLALGVVATLAWGLPGLLVATALAPLIPLTWAVARRALARPEALSLPVARRLVRTGAPMVLLALLDQSLLTMDQVLVMAFLSLRDLGLYNVAFVLAEGLRTAGAAGAAVLGPRLLREHARSGGRVEAIRSHTLQPVLLYAFALPLPTALLWLGGGFALPRFFPAYAEAVRPMQVLLLAGGFLVVLGGVTTFLFAIDKHARNLMFLVPALAFNVGLDIVLLRRGWGLMAIATGSLVTYAGYAAAVLWYVSGHFALGRAARSRLLVQALLPGVATGLVLAAIEHGWPAYHRSLSGAAVACVAASLLAAPLAARAGRLARTLDAADR